VGLLPARDSDDQRVANAYNLYSETCSDDEKWKKKQTDCATFKASESSIDVKIEFVGVWYASFFNVTEILGI
jgi:hypothetical protein